MCVFPNIQYVNDFVPLQGNDAEALPPSPRAMFTNLVNHGIVDNHFLDGINNMYELEMTVFALIDHYPENGASLERIFHLIQIWGGRTGRGIYNRQPFHWADIEPLYQAFIDFFRFIQMIDDAILIDAFNEVNGFYDALHRSGYKGMNVAFITKHSRFWMHRNLPNEMLPIYDRTFSVSIMLRGAPARLVDLLDYWRAMVAKAERENVSLTSLERQLFNYY